MCRNWLPVENNITNRYLELQRDHSEQWLILCHKELTFFVVPQDMYAPFSAGCTILHLGFSSKVSMLQFLILTPETWRLYFASPSPYDFSINLPQLFCMCRSIWDPSEKYLDKSVVHISKRPPSLRSLLPLNQTATGNFTSAAMRYAGYCASCRKRDGTSKLQRESVGCLMQAGLMKQCHARALESVMACCCRGPARRRLGFTSCAYLAA